MTCVEKMTVKTWKLCPKTWNKCPKLEKCVQKLEKCVQKLEKCVQKLEKCVQKLFQILQKAGNPPQIGARIKPVKLIKNSFFSARRPRFYMICKKMGVQRMFAVVRDCQQWKTERKGQLVSCPNVQLTFNSEINFIVKLLFAMLWNKYYI